MNMIQFKLMKKIPVFSMLLLASIMLFKGCSRGPKTHANTLTVGMMSGWPPYMTINKQSNFEGFDVDVAQEAAKRMGKQLVIEDLGGLDALLIALERNKINMLFSGLDITPKRLNTMEMVQYTGEGIKAFNLLFWKTIPTQVKTLKDLATQPNNTICVEPGSPSEQFLQQKQFTQIDKKPISRVIDMLLEIKSGRSTAAILEPVAAQELMKKNPEIKMLKVPLPQEFQILGVGIALKKGNLELKKQLEEAINSMKQDGTLKKLEQKWHIPGTQD